MPNQDEIIQALAARVADQAKTIQALVSRAIEQEASIGTLRGYCGILLAEEAKRCGKPETTALIARDEILSVEQQTLADYLEHIENRDPALAALLDKRNPGDVPTTGFDDRS